MFKRVLAFIFSLGLAFVAAPAVADTTISGLPAATTLTPSTDLTVCVHFVGGAGTTQKCTINQLLALITGYVDTTTAQTIGGAKTFSSTVAIGSASYSSTGVTTGSSVYGSTGAIVAGGVQAVGGGVSATALGSFSAPGSSNGDAAFQRTASSGGLFLGGASGSVRFDYGVTTPSVATINKPLNITGVTTVSGNVGAVGGGVLAWAGGAFSSPGASSGDAVLQRSASTGAMWLGGATQSARIDYNSTISGSVSVNAPLTVTGAIQASAGTPTAAGSSSGDLIAQRTVNQGALFLGGSTAAGTIDFNINNPGAISLKTAAGAYAPVFGGTYTPSSDRRWKMNIHDTSHGLDDIMQLEPRDFEWISGGKSDTGFIAQEVKPVLPELVSRDRKGYYGFEYANLTAVLVKAVQQQQGEILMDRALAIAGILMGGLGIGLHFRKRAA